jgi:heme transport system ATP-binding protein
MLTLSNISLTLGHTTILKDINFSIEAGELVVILGPNGAGKSSLLNVACGELTASEGEVRCFSHALDDMPVLEKARLMAVLPQQSHLEFPFEVHEVVALARIPHNTGAAADAVIIEQALAAMDITHLSKKLYTQLSGGEKQRVQLARVLAQLWEQKGVMMLDEPTAALDFSHQHEIMEILKSKSRNSSSILMVLHDLNLAASYADRVIVVNHGEICAMGEPKDVLKEALLLDVFGVKFHRVKHPETGKTLFVS